MAALLNNWEVAQILGEIADLLTLKGENPFKIRAYENAAATVSRLPVPVSALDSDGLKDLPGVGKALAEKIFAITRTGTCPLLDRLYQEVPRELRVLLRVPGLGRKRAQQLFAALSPTGLADLSFAAEEGRVAALPGMGPRAEKALLEFLQSSFRWSIRSARLISASVQDLLLEAGIAAVPVGEVRRRKETVAQAELVSSACREQVKTALHTSPLLEALQENDSGFDLKTRVGINVCLWLCSPRQYPWKLLWLTGSSTHLELLAQVAAGKGYQMDAGGLIKNDEPLYLSGEEDYYRELGLEYIPPELREGGEEITAALEGRLPNLVRVADIKGDLHLHSRWSDGREDIEALAEAARLKGYQYLAVTDHSRSLKVARGLSEEQLLRQVEQIKSLNSEGKPYILRGIEVDILPDGSLDLPDHILMELDLVIASVHSAFNQSEAEMTRRVCKAASHPAVTAIGHPTGRLLSRRLPYKIDVTALLETAARRGTWIEINSNPDRLDLSWTYLQEARQLGVKVLINTDAHDSVDLDEIEYGVGEARRGWLEAEDVINTLPLEALQTALRRRRDGSSASL